MGLLGSSGFLDVVLSFHHDSGRRVWTERPLLPRPRSPPTLVSISSERPLLSTTETDLCRAQILNVTGKTFPL